MLISMLPRGLHDLPPAYLSMVYSCHSPLCPISTSCSLNCWIFSYCQAFHARPRPGKSSLLPRSLTPPFGWVTPISPYSWRLTLGLPLLWQVLSCLPSADKIKRPSLHASIELSSAYSELGTHQHWIVISSLHTWLSSWNWRYLTAETASDSFSHALAPGLVRTLND